MDKLDFKNTYDENEAFANNLFSQVITEKDQDAVKKKTSLYGQFAEAAEEGKNLEEKTQEKIDEAGETEKIPAEPLMMDVSSAHDEKKVKRANADLIFIIAIGIAALLFVFALGLFIGTRVMKNKIGASATVDFSNKGLNTDETAKFQAAYDFVIENYYKEPDVNKLIEGAIEGMVDALDDPYGGYKKPEEMSKYESYIEGKDEEGNVKASVSYNEVENSVYCIKIDQFIDGTANEFKTAVTEIAQKGCKGIIIDLRNNPGGYADESVAVADIILPSGVVALAKDKTGKTVDTYKSDKNEISVPVCLLVNENTASAAELVTGAFRDMNKGEIIGTHTYGKALAQITADFENDGSGIVLSAYTYCTPSGECIDGVGIEPSIVVSNEEGSEEDLQLARALEEILKNV